MASTSSEKCAELGAGATLEAVSCGGSTAEATIARPVTFVAPPADDSVPAPKKGGTFYLACKRGFDIVFSLVVCILLFIPVAVVAIAIVIESPGNPFFRQSRVGKNGKTIGIFKLRTMVPDAHSNPEKYFSPQQLETWRREQKVDDDPRVTRVGRFLRNTSIDEVPQFLNVLKGDIPLRILKTRPELSAKDKGAFALPAKSSTNEGKAFSQVVSCFANGLRVRRAASSNCNPTDAAEVGFLAKPIFGAVCA